MGIISALLALSTFRTRNLDLFINNSLLCSTRRSWDESVKYFDSERLFFSSRPF
jgi:hypothetical protein